jgi:phosphoribosylglycinamide formyltransferase 1
MIKLAIFASGNGSNAENIVRYFNDNQEISISRIYCNKADAFVLERAKILNLPTMVFLGTDLLNSDLVLNQLIEDETDFVILAGFLLKIPSNLIEAFPNRIINIHPALLPDFGGKGMYGMKVHHAVKASGENKSGITIHFVNENYDEGNIIFQAWVPVEAEDSAEEIAEKVHKLEYEHFPNIINQIIIDTYED